MPALEASLTGTLHGIRVIDADEGAAAGYCSRLLACLGADVVKVERPGIGDALRRAGPFPSDRPDIEASGMHLHLNAGKRSVTIDVTSTSGAALLSRLIGTAQAVITPARMHPSSRRDLDAGRAIVARITPYGGGGPRSSWRAPEVIAMALGGYLSLNGDPDRAPIKVWGEQAHYQAGIHAALAIVAGLRAAADGAAAQDGEHAEVSVVEAAGFLTAGAQQRWHLMQRPQVRAGARPAGFAANRLYPSTVRPCADGHVHVHCHNRHHDLISLLVEDESLRASDVMEEPLGHADAIDAGIDGWLATRTRVEAVAAAQELRVPMTEVFSPAEILEDVAGHHAAREFFKAVEHPAVGILRMPGPPIRFDGAETRLRRAPLLGEHNVDVLSGELGLSPRDLSRLRAAGAV